MFFPLANIAHIRRNLKGSGGGVQHHRQDWVCELCQSSRIPNIRKRNFAETGCEGRETVIPLGPLVYVPVYALVYAAVMRCSS